MLKYFGLILFSLLLIAPDSSAVKKPKQKIFSDPDKTIIVKTGEEFVIKIKANHTTGYEWMAAEPFDSTIVVLADRYYISDKAPKGWTGIGGNEFWKFRAVKKGKTILRFKEVRPWQADEPNPPLVSFTVEVK